ncbi:MAG: class I SAM-dependent methyltransferase [Pseudomonadota bacterium]
MIQQKLGLFVFDHMPHRMREAITERLDERFLSRINNRLNKMPKPALEQHHLEHATPLTDRMALLERLPMGGRVAELGVNEGDFSQAVLKLNKPTELILIDYWGSERYGDAQMRRVNERFKAQISSGAVRIERGLSTEVAAALEDDSLDWAYIDTDHSYPTTRDELRIISRKIKTGGMIAGHDYVGGNWRTAYPYGVMNAVFEFCVQEDWEIVYLTMELAGFTGNPSFAIRKRSG